MSINFVTFDMLNNLLIKNLPQIPHDVDVVVGVPRSGLLLANMIACYLNKPLADVESVLAGKWFESGRTKNKTGWVRNFSTVKKILVVDDSVDTGKSIKPKNVSPELMSKKFILLPLSLDIQSI